ncbi:MAG: glycosyltransferase [Chromatiales bacterium]|nr:glycosyltransferase [Chromatiales bacterium]
MVQRIAFIIDSYTGPWAGTERQLWYLLQHLDRERFEPHLVILRHADYSRNTQAWPCPVHVLELGSLASIKGMLGFFRLVTLLKHIDARIVHAYFQDASMIGPLAAKLAGARFVAGRRDMGIWYTRANLRVLRLFAPLVDAVIANSKAVREQVAIKEGVSSARIAVIYNGLDAGSSAGNVASLDDVIPANAPVIGIVANLHHVKRHADLIRAFRRVVEAVPEAHLVLVGQGELESELRQLAAAEGVSGQTHFLGRVEQPVGVIRRFTVAALCSASEGLSNALMECLREGKPAVCSNVGGNPELVTDGVNGYLYPVGDEAELADQLVRLLQDDTLRSTMGEAAASAMAGMTLDAMVNAHMDFYASLLEGKKMPLAESQSLYSSLREYRGKIGKS